MFTWHGIQTVPALLPSHTHPALTHQRAMYCVFYLKVPGLEYDYFNKTSPPLRW